MKPARKHCMRTCVNEMRRLLKLDRETQKLILGDNWQKQLQRFRELIARYEQECVQDWLQRNWPLF